MGLIGRFFGTIFDAHKVEETLENENKHSSECAAQWMHICDTDLVIDWKELPGALNNARIVDAFKAEGYGPLPDETSWCGVYVASVLRRAGFKPPLKAAWARNYSGDWGELLTAPVYGCIVNCARPDGIGQESHVGFVVSFDDKFVRIHGGNQHNTVNRSMVVPRERVISYKWPIEKI